jgi:N-acetylglucosamine-6-sulfatase
VAPYDRGIDADGTFTPLDGYITDLLTDMAVDWLRSRTSTAPFCLVVGHKACHAPFEPAPRHAEAFADAEVPEPLPDTDEAYEGIPEWLRRQRESLFGVDRPYNQWPDFRSWYLDYHRTLLAVDEGVGRLLATLEDLGQLDDTLVIYLSDNGFMHGEKGTLDKRCFYEPSIRIPWLVRAGGPSVGALEPMVLNLDVAPTILDALGLLPAPTMQGASVLPMVLGDPVRSWRDDFLYEYFFEPSFPSTPTVIGVRTATHKLIRYHGVWSADEVYDLVADPAERDNLVRSEPQRRKGLSRRLDRLTKEHGLLEQPLWGEAQRDPARAAVPNGPKVPRPPGGEGVVAPEPGASPPASSPRTPSPRRPR